MNGYGSSCNNHHSVDKCMCNDNNIEQTYQVIKLHLQCVEETRGRQRNKFLSLLFLLNES